MFSDLLSAAFRDTKSHRGGPDDVGSPREGNISPFRRPDEMASSKPYTIADRQGDLEQYASQLDSTDPISTPISVEVSAESAAENEIQVAIDLRAKGEAKKALNSLLSLSKGPIFLHLSAMKQADIFILEGEICCSRGSNLRALHYYVKALAVYEEANLTHEKCYLFGTIADILCELKNYEKAIEYYNYQIALATRHEYKSLHVRGLVHLGMSYMTHDVFEKAVVVFEQCLRTFCVGPQTDSDFQSIAKTCLINLGISYHQLGVFDQAIDAFDTCLKTVGTTTVEVLEAATVKVHMSCTLLMKQRYSDAIVTGISAITDFSLYRQSVGILPEEQEDSIEQLESRAYTWIQLGQLKQGNYMDSIATLEAASNKGIIDEKSPSRDMREYLTAIKRAVLAIVTMMNRPLFIFQCICLQGFPHHLLVYVIIPTSWGSFKMRFRSFPLGSRGICDIRQWILMCRFNIGMEALEASATRSSFSTLTRSHKRLSFNQPLIKTIESEYDAEYSCIIPGPGNSESIVNPEIFYKAATAKRPALFNPYNLKIMPQVSIGECENAFPRRSIHSGVNFMDFELNEISTIDSCFVQKVYFPERKNFKYSSDTAGTRRTFRLGTKVFEACREMYDLLLGSFEKELQSIPQGSEIVVIPYGPLMLIPFPCLQNVGEKYLLEIFRIRHLKSLMLAWRLNTRGRKDLTERAFEMKAKNPSFLECFPAPPICPLIPGPSAHSMWRNVALVGKTSFTRHTQLIGPDQEAFLIEELLLSYGISCKTYGEDGPTPTDVEIALRESSLLHIASHGSSNCAILRDSASGDDYEFSLEDLVRIQTAQGPFSPLLVVLNTCSGSQRKSVSSISSHSRFTNLAHALLAGGVRCVISSTARVHDSIAQEIMTNFYHGLLGSHTNGVTFDVAESLQAALLHQSMQHPTDPSCWAGYIVSGFVRDITDR